MEFEFDAAKSEGNLVKHGIDFTQAQQLWADPNLLEVPARTQGESRWMVVAMIGEKHYSAIITYRETKVRIISVRASRREEVTLYED